MSRRNDFLTDIQKHKKTDLISIDRDPLSIKGLQIIDGSRDSY